MQVLNARKFNTSQTFLNEQLVISCFCLSCFFFPAGAFFRLGFFPGKGGPPFPKFSVICPQLCTTSCCFLIMVAGHITIVEKAACVIAVHVVVHVSGDVFIIDRTGPLIVHEDGGRVKLLTSNVRPNV